MNHQDLLKLFEGGEVRRFHAHPVHTHQTNSHHGARVAAIANYLEPNLSKDMLVYCLFHDAPEAITGDMPGPAKRRWPKLGELMNDIHHEFLRENGITYVPSSDEHKIMKIADYLETMLFCCEEKDMGNSTMHLIYQNCLLAILRFHEYLDDKSVQLRSNLLIQTLTRRFEYYE